MPIMNILSAAERTELEKPPVFNSTERKQYFDLPIALLDAAEKMRKFETRIGFVLMCAYFRSARRFYSPQDFHQKDMEAARHKLGIVTDPFVASKYTDTSRSRHQKIILNFYGFRMFDRNAERLLRAEVSNMMRGASEAAIDIRALSEFPDPKPHSTAHNSDQSFMKRYLLYWTILILDQRAYDIMLAVF